MTIFLATRETEIREIMVLGQPGQIVQKTLSQKMPNTRKRWCSVDMVPA
jgi:hypothetical protein